MKSVPVVVFVIGIGKIMSGVELLLFLIGSRHDHPQILLNMLHSQQMRCSLRFLQKQHQRVQTPFLILQQYFPITQQQPLILSDRPVIFYTVADEQMSQLLGVQA